jgi:hypothetical protein
MGKQIKDALLKTVLTLVSSGAFVFQDNIFGYICAGSVLASVIASSVSDKNLKPLLIILNHLAANIDKAENNPNRQI